MASGSTKISLLHFSLATSPTTLVFTTFFTSCHLPATSSSHPNPCPFQVSYVYAEGWFCPWAANP